MEHAQRTLTEEFHELYYDVTLPAPKCSLRVGECVYNTVRPHQSLRYLTPRQFLLQHAQREEA